MGQRANADDTTDREMNFFVEFGDGRVGVWKGLRLCCSWLQHRITCLLLAYLHANERLTRVILAGFVLCKFIK